MSLLSCHEMFTASLIAPLRYLVFPCIFVFNSKEKKLIANGEKLDTNIEHFIVKNSYFHLALYEFYLLFYGQYLHYICQCFV
jgi:hypothetical protein